MKMKDGSPVPGTLTTAPGFTTRSVDARNTSLWSDVGLQMERRCTVLRVYGDNDTGRTRFGLTAPGPIAYLHSLEKKDGILEEYRQYKEIFKVNFGRAMHGSTDEIKDMAEQQVSLVQTAVLDALTWAKTIFIDTETVLWQYIQLAYLGSLSQEEQEKEDKKKGQLKYTLPNNRYRWFFNIVREHAETFNRVNFILASQTKNEFKKNVHKGSWEKTDRTVLDGQGEIDNYLYDVVVRTYRQGSDYTAVVLKSWMNAGMRDAPFVNDHINFPNVMSWITGLPIEEWS